MARIQFILKARENPFTDEAPPDGVKKKFLSSGLLNSATFVMNMLKDMGHTVQLDHAIDNNCVHSTAIVETENGPMRISELVRNKYTGKVLSFNEKTKKNEWNNVTDWMKKPFKNAGKDFVKVRTVSAIQVPLCTSDHRFAVVDDPLKPEIYWTEAKNLTGKYIVSNKQANLYNDEQSMDYKLPPEFRTEPENKHKFNTDRLDYSLHEVVSALPCGRKSALYDITVENNHNFFADGVLIHNCIDRLVTGFKPDIAIIEAYWVVPEKFEILTKLHPKIKWVIRNHSALPFLANEGMAMDWSLRYMDYKNVFLCSNDARTDLEMKDLISVYKPDWSRAQVEDRVSLLSNFYPTAFTSRPRRERSEYVDLACFGALRPLKNHLIQATAAIQFAEKYGKKLRFHINGTRIEMKGEPIARNLSKLFENLPKHELVQHPWKDHPEFCATLREMDCAMQVSYTETFNIVTADAVVNDVPVITSNDIVWVDPRYYADPNSSSSMVKVLERVIFGSEDHITPNINGLNAFNNKSKSLWGEFINRQ